MANIKPYTGSEPYIFISYAHRNSELVLPMIEQLIVDGYRVWYDEGIDPGTEWTKTIATRIKDCSCMLAMLSEEYIASENCRDEIELAKSLNLPRLVIHLKPTSLPIEMQMTMNRLQAVFKYKYTDEKEFYKKLYEAEILDICNPEPPEREKFVAHERPVGVNKPKYNTQTYNNNYNNNYVPPDNQSSLPLLMMQRNAKAEEIDRRKRQCYENAEKIKRERKTAIIHLSMEAVGIISLISAMNSYDDPVFSVLLFLVGCIGFNFCAPIDIMNYRNSSGGTIKYIAWLIINSYILGIYGIYCCVKLIMKKIPNPESDNEVAYLESQLYNIDAQIKMLQGN